MSDINTKINAIIQAAAIDGTLTQSAISQFNTLVEDYEELHDKYKVQLKGNEAVKKDRDEIRKERDSAVAECNDYIKRDADLCEREAKMTEMEVREECTKLRIADHQEMFRVVFRNAVIKRDVVTPGSASFDQYNSKTDNFPDKTPIEEEET